MSEAKIKLKLFSYKKIAESKDYYAEYTSLTFLVRLNRQTFKVLFSSDFKDGENLEI